MSGKAMHIATIVCMSHPQYACRGHPMVNRRLMSKGAAALRSLSGVDPRIGNDRMWGKHLGTNESLSMEHFCLVVRYLAAPLLTRPG